ncbi:MAG TPA: M23 family metallopeptidase, partial [Candidatus Polarisedimenticolia bacterium]|nr:M23 family metallopeptidase [Candidatus Polarisedimenticolia bacterium]
PAPPDHDGETSQAPAEESRGKKEERGQDEDEGRDEARTAAAPALAWPIQGLITAPFGRRGKEDHHEGIDIDGQTGDPIHAAASGTVVFAGTHGDYGRTVVIDHGDGLRTVYAHASILKVQEGDPVRIGETIAEVGHSGNARGSHLHFEVRRDGRPVNPIPFLRSPDLLTASVVPTPAPQRKSAKKKAAPHH